MAHHRGGRQDRPLLGRVHRQRLRRPDRPHVADRQRGDVLGRRRHRARRSSAPRSPSPASSRNGTPEQIAEWVPQCFGTPEKIQLARFAVSEPDAGSDVSSLRTRAVYDEAKDEWVLNGTKTWITNGGIADVHVIVATVEPELARARSRQLRGAARHARPDHGPEVQEARHPRQPHRRGHPRRRAASPAAACSAARRSSTRASRVSAKAGSSRVQAAMARSRRPSRSSARRPSASPRRRTSTRSTTRRSACSSAGRSSRTRPSRSSSPT